ncbi:RNA-directed DNA polymerase [Rhizobium leguminosarum]|uniref:RNA-directed DNA polymerase n=1 Tax=Rhizobium leguminosarum TaxID=384 RepID=UPI003F990981
MTIQCGSLALDAEKIEKQLRQDFRDDWFPDPINYSDMFSGDVLEGYISSNIENNDGEYRPIKAQLLNIPKANFTLRYALETSLADRAIYHGLASELLPYFDHLISWQVFSHRLPTAERDKERVGTKYMFRSGVRAWSDFLGCVEAKLSPNSVLLSTDLANYFENISIPLLRTRFLDLVPQAAPEQLQPEIQARIEELFTYLSAWCFKEDRGLPQNRDASSFLANIYMREVDIRMIEAGFQYYRYMDDIKIVCDSKASARKALKEFVLALRPIGQFVNSGKTKIVSAEDRELIKECLAAGSVEMKRIATAWNSKSLKPISRTLVPLKNLMLRTLREEKFDSREFRFCISRLETLARCSEFNVPPDYFAEVTSRIIDGLDIAPVATDQMVRYLRSVSLDDEAQQALVEHVSHPDKTIYNWKNYRIWLLLAQRGICTNELKVLARQIIEAREDDPTRAGASLYLGCLGTKADREFIAERFSSLTSYLGQRAAILAVQELHFSGKGGNVTIKDAVAPFLRSDLRGTYSNLKRAGTYVAELEPLSVTNFLDLERDYA